MPDENVAIRVEHVSKEFKLPHERQTSIKGALISRLRSGKRTYERQQVLHDISFDIKKGEFFGIVGRNGSGKSTLLKMLAGIYTPTKGGIQINGKLTPFIELGVGFNPELTGRENVYLSGALLGFNRSEMDLMYSDIVSFAELEKFMDQKLKNYSSGMQVRLAFSIAIRARSDILILDEVLAVGDAIFQKKCFEYFKQLKKDKRTVVFVSHDTNALQEYCDKGILIESGDLVQSGDIKDVVNNYLEILNTRERGSQEAAPEATAGHVGSGEVTIASLRTSSTASGKRQRLFTEADDTIEITAAYSVHETTEEPIYGITVYDAAGIAVFATNTMWNQQKMATVHPGKKVQVTWSVPNVFATGDFTLTPAVAAAGGTAMLDQVEGMASFKVRKKRFSSALTNVDYAMKVDIA